MVKLIKDDLLHVPKEKLVVGVNRLDCKSKFHVFVSWPTCSKDDYEGTYNLVASLSKEYHQLTERYMMNICTDGDAARRIVMHNYCDKDLSLLSSLCDILGSVPHLDICCEFVVCIEREQCFKYV